MKAKIRILYSSKKEEGKFIEVANPKLIDYPITISIEGEEFAYKTQERTTERLKKGEYYFMRLSLRERTDLGRELVRNAVNKAFADGKLVKPESKKERAHFDSEITKTIISEGAKQSNKYKENLLVAIW